MNSLEVLPAFTKVLNIPCVISADELTRALQEMNKKASIDKNEFFTPREIDLIHSKTQGGRIFIAIKTLIATIYRVKDLSPEIRPIKFLHELEEDGALKTMGHQEHNW